MSNIVKKQLVCLKVLKKNDYSGTAWLFREYER